MGGPAGSLRSRQHSSRGHRGTQASPPRQGSSQEKRRFLLHLKLLQTPFTAPKLVQTPFTAGPKTAADSFYSTQAGADPFYCRPKTAADSFHCTRTATDRFYSTQTATDPFYCTQNRCRHILLHPKPLQSKFTAPKLLRTFFSARKTRVATSRYNVCLQLQLVLCQYFQLQ